MDEPPPCSDRCCHDDDGGEEAAEGSAAGAAYHTPLPADWVCLPFADVLALTDACFAAGHDSTAWPLNALDRKAPAQTLPAPTNALKAVAASGMRSWSRVQVLREGPPRPDTTDQQYCYL
eukprot:7240119-Prymnesium_polylepis.1